MFQGYFRVSFCYSKYSSTRIFEYKNVLSSTTLKVGPSSEFFVWHNTSIITSLKHLFTDKKCTWTYITLFVFIVVDFMESLRCQLITYRIRIQRDQGLIPTAEINSKALKLFCLCNDKKSPECKNRCKSRKLYFIYMSELKTFQDCFYKIFL